MLHAGFRLRWHSSDTVEIVRTSYWTALLMLVPLAGCFADVPGAAPSELFPGENGFGERDAGSGGGVAGGGSGSLDGGAVEDAALLSDAYVMGTTSVSCDGVAVGETQQRTRYAQAQVVAPDTCQSELQTRTCEAGGFSDWTGTYDAESCVSATVRSCGPVASGDSQTRTRFFAATVDNYMQCQSEEQTRTCTDGSFSAWTGTARYASCSVSFLGQCNPLSSIACEPQTSCVGFWPLPAQCLGLNGHSCTENADCKGTCVEQSCVAAQVARGGACDDAADCAACTGGQVACSNKACLCGDGAACANNNECVGTCVAQQCVPANTTCDKSDDCRDGRTCVKAGVSATGTCLLPSGAACTDNAQCEVICRVDMCAGLGIEGDACDEGADCAAGLSCSGASGAQHCTSLAAQGESCAQTSDCQSPLVCRMVSGSMQCATAATLASPCTADGDCAAGLTCAAVAAAGDAGAGFKLCLTKTGGACVNGVTCASGVCSSSGPGGMGTCQ